MTRTFLLEARGQNAAHPPPQRPAIVVIVCSAGEDLCIIDTHHAKGYTLQSLRKQARLWNYCTKIRPLGFSQFEIVPSSIMVGKYRAS